MALTALAAHAAILARRSRRIWIGWGVSATAPMVALLPLFWWGVHQRQTQLHWVPSVTAGAVYTFPAMLTGSAETAWLLIGLVLAAILVRRSRSLADVLIAAGVPLLVVGAISAIGPSFWVIRYLLFVLMPAGVIAAAGLTSMVESLRLRPAMVMVLGPLLVFAAAAVPGQLAVRGPTVKNGGDYRTAAGIIRGRQAPGDVIVYQQGLTMRAGVGFYLRHDASAPQDILMRSSAAERGLLTAAEYPDPGVRLAAVRRMNSPGASGSGWPSPARSSAIADCCWPMNRPARSIRPTAKRSCVCC